MEHPITHLVALPLCACGCQGVLVAFTVEVDGSITERLLDRDISHDTACAALGYLAREQPTINLSEYPVVDRWTA